MYFTLCTCKHLVSRFYFLLLWLEYPRCEQTPPTCSLISSSSPPQTPCHAPLWHLSRLPSPSLTPPPNLYSPSVQGKPKEGEREGERERERGREEGREGWREEGREGGGERDTERERERGLHIYVHYLLWLLSFVNILKHITPASLECGQSWYPTWPPEHSNKLFSTP